MLIALEGIDGVGKSSLARSLAEMGRENGLLAKIVSFPHYHDTTFGELIALYLNGRFGDVTHVSEYLSSLLFAAERYEYRAKLKEATRDFDLVLVDRYVASNIAYNCAKVDSVRWHELARWVEQLEFEMFKIPRPDAQILLRLDAHRAADLLAGRMRKSYTEHRDVYESDASLLTRCASVYDWLARQNAVSPWIVEEVGDAKGGLRRKDTIAQEVWRALVSEFDDLTRQGVLIADQPLRLFDAHHEV